VSEPPEWQWTKPGKYIKRAGDSKLYRMQDLPDRYIATGTCQFVRTATLEKCKSNAAFSYLGDQIIPVMDEEAIEVHNIRDFRVAKALLEEEKA